MYQLDKGTNILKTNSENIFAMWDYDYECISTTNTTAIHIVIRNVCVIQILKQLCILMELIQLCQTNRYSYGNNIILTTMSNKSLFLWK